MLSDLDKDAQTLSEVIDQAAKNQVVDLFSKNMLLDKNRTDLLTPITFESVKGLRLETKKQLESLLENDTFYDDLSKAGLIQLKC